MWVMLWELWGVPATASAFSCRVQECYAGILEVAAPLQGERDSFPGGKPLHEVTMEHRGGGSRGTQPGAADGWGMKPRWAPTLLT